MENKYIKLRKKPFKTFSGLVKEAIGANKVKIHKAHMRDILTLFLGIITTNTTRLITTSEKTYSRLTNCAKSLENRLSYFLNKPKTLKEINQFFKSLFILCIKKIESRCETFMGKKILIIDWTCYSKRARLNKKNMGMEYVSKVYDARKGKEVNGYGAFIGALLLKDKQVYPLFHHLFSTKYYDEISQNQFELQAIEDSGVGSAVIIVGDAYFCKKSFLSGIYKQGKDFLFRIKRDILIDDNEHLFHKIERENEHKIIWRRKKEEIEGIAKFLKAKTIFRSGKLKEKISLTCIKVEVPIYEEPLFIVTSLKVTYENLQAIIELYNKRWAIETFIESLKQNFGIEEFMVRKWEAIKLLCNIVLSAYIVFLLLFLTSSERFLMELSKFLRKNSILARLTIGRVIHAYSLLLTGDFGDIMEEYVLIQILSYFTVFWGYF